jgi:MFS family permease
MQQLAINWLVYRLTHSSAWLGVVNFLSQFPTFLLGLFTGVLVDRVDRHRLLKWTQGLSAIQAFILAILTLSGKINLFEVIVFSTLLGVINAVDMPARQSFVIQMIGDKKDLANAIALNSSIMNGTRLVGPAIAGLVIVAVGEGGCFLLNAVSYIGVLIALNIMEVNQSPKEASPESVRSSILLGVKFAFDFKPIRYLLILMSLLSLIGAPFVIVLPIVADQVLHGGAPVLGILSTSVGLGGFAAAIWLASRKSVIKMGHSICACSLIFSSTLFAAAIASSLPTLIPILFFAGFGMMLQMAGTNILIQTWVEDDKRGRVMGIFSIAILGFTPFGSLLVGGMVEKFGLSSTFLFCGGVYLSASLWFIVHLDEITHYLKPIYLKIGLISHQESEQSSRIFKFF